MTTTNTLYRNSLFALVAVLLLALPLAFASADGGDDIGVWEGNYYPDTSTNYYPDTVSNYYPDTVSNYYPDTVSNYYPDTVSNYYPDTYSYTPSYTGSFGGGSGYSYGGGLSGSWMLGGGSSVGGGYGGGGTSVWNSNTNVNQNYCTNGSCNTVFNDNSIFNAPTVVTTDSHNIVTNPAPQTIIYASQPPVYTPPTYYPPTYYPPAAPVCNSCGCPGYQSCSRPITYNAQPYVTLASVPYTGLELGPVGTALYWGFLVLWCLIAAYLIAVKKIQNTIVAWFAGSKTTSHTTQAASTHTTNASATHRVASKSAPVVETNQFDGIDPFIQSQISR